MDEVRIVLLGKQGAGKSASGNTLLGDQLFKSDAHTDRVTQTCLAQTSTVDNQSITVVDTPGWPDSSSETEIKQEIMKCIDMCSPGPHVFLLVLPIGRFTYEEIKTIIDIMIEFGPEAYKHMLLLFTRGDDLAGNSIEEYLENTNQDFKNILQKCLGGHHVFNNSNISNQNQVSSLLQKINQMVDKNDKSYYTKIMDQNVKDQQREDEECSTKVENLAPNSGPNDTELEKREVRKQSGKEGPWKKEENNHEIMLWCINIKTSVEKLEQRINRIEQQLAEIKKYKQDEQTDYLENHQEGTDEKQSEMLLSGKEEKTSARDFKQLGFKIDHLKLELEKNQQDTNRKLYEYLDKHLGEINNVLSEIIGKVTIKDEEDEKLHSKKGCVNF